MGTPCWIWTGATQSKGYKHFRVGNRWRLAHVFSHEVFIGPVPKGMQVHHRCLNQVCCAPDHLEAVTGEANRLLQAMGVGDLEEVPI